MATRIQSLSSQCLAILPRLVNLILEGGGYFLTSELSEKNWKSSLSSEERARGEEVAKLTVHTFEWLPSFSVLENSHGKRFRWCGRNGMIRFINDSSGRRVIDVTGKLQQFNPGSFNLFAEREGQLRQFVLSADPILVP